MSASPDVAPREATYRYESLPLIGKVSSWLSQRLVLSHLRSGTWLDLLSGYRSSLQVSQLHSRATTLYALDHRLDPRLRSYGINLTEMHVDGSLPYRDHVFDNVTIINGLEHLYHPDAVLREIHRTLKPGGVLQVVVPTWFGKPFLEFLAFELHNPQAYLEMNDHKMYYDESTLWPMLIRAGFQPRDVTLKRIKLYCSLYARACKAGA
jgi:SAM-dependent methyltransferase